MTADATSSSAPESFEGLRDRILERRDQFPKRLAQVARFALESPDDMALNTVAEIAGKADVQPSTLIRFAQSLGYSGFSDLQQIFRSRLRDRWPDYAERLQGLRSTSADEGGPVHLLDGFAQTAMDSLLRLRERVSEPDLNAAVDLLAGAKTVYILGQRRAFPVASYLAYAFGKLGIRFILLDNLGALLPEQAGFIDPDDALIAISFTPYTPSTVEMTTLIGRRGVPILAITDSAFSPLAPIAKVWLEVAETDFGAFRSLAATLCLAMALAVATAEKRAGA